MGALCDFESTIIPNGVDVKYWAGKPSARYLRPGMRNLIYLGRLEQRNGPEVAIDAFAAIAPAIPDIRLVMAGDGPIRAALEARVPEALRDRVEFVGAVFDERPDLLASSSVFLLPARAVGFSIMVLEAFAAGLPVVALPGLGTDRAGDHWSNVMVARHQSVAAFADAIVETLHGTRARASRAGGRSRASTIGSGSGGASSTSSGRSWRPRARESRSPMT